jgi:hypothetical protein
VVGAEQLEDGVDLADRLGLGEQAEQGDEQGGGGFMAAAEACGTMRAAYREAPDRATLVSVPPFAGA